MRLAQSVQLRTTPFESLPGWRDADLSAIWPVFHAGASAVATGVAPLRPAQPVDAALQSWMRAVEGLRADLPGEDARRFFETHCDLFAVDHPGFVTGYYEPVVAASPVRTVDFTAPVLPRPNDLVSFAPGEQVSGLPAEIAAARRRSDGTLEPYADRATIEEWAEGPEARPLLWLQDWTEVFLVQVQGSARVRLPDGRERRLVYAGRNGLPYTSIGRLLVERGDIPMHDMSLERLKAWLRANGQRAGDRGRDLMQRNASYIFFELTDFDQASGPIGGAGLPLTPGISIAIDRSIWPYGLPFWIASDEPVPGFGPDPLARLFVGQDTGSAIVGPARADLFTGSGEQAGHHAGLIRHAARVHVLLPKAA